MKSYLPICASLALFAAGAAAAQPAAGGGVREGCKADVEKFCPNLQPGERPMKCMKEHLSELSDTCKSAIAKARAAREAGKGKSDAPPAPGGGQ